MISGKLVIIQGIEREHLPLLKAWRNNPEVYSTLFEHELLTDTHQERWYQRLLDRTDQRQWLITTTDATPIGVIGFSQLDWRNRSAEWGFYIGEMDYRMGGYAAEAEFLLLDYGFNHLNLHRIWCRTFAFNKKVLAMHKRFQFQQEGMLRESAYHNGSYENVVLMGILKTEFNKHRSTFESLFNHFNEAE
jgi:UDP-4-amino-4,6-dideoxy-N-acetyl-beta-L-altrosamine N-acetyltransferase